MWKQNDYLLGNTDALTAENLSAAVYDRVCRYEFSVPRFILLDFGRDYDSQFLRRQMVNLKRQLNQLHEERHGMKLVYTSMGRFDQQVTTKPHRDGGPDESVLMLGYEPTPVKSRVSISDYTKCAFDLGMTPTEFLDQLNPMFVDGQDALVPYTTSLEAFDHTTFQILVLNNSNLPHDANEKNLLGVLHTAEIINPMPDKHRVVNSTMVASVDHSVEEEVSEREQQDFIDTDLVRVQSTARQSKSLVMQMIVFQLILRLLAIIWASPYTLFGLVIGVAGLCTGGRAQIRGKVVEFYGGAVKWFLSRIPGGQFAIAITFGHTVLGKTDAALDISREHELVHVRQYERWGPFFGPAYLLCSLVLWLKGKDAYRDNPFERQAYDEAG